MRFAKPRSSLRPRRWNGPGVTKDGKGWNETQNACLIRFDHNTCSEDPKPDPPAGFLNAKHVAKIAETEALSVAAAVPKDDATSEAKEPDDALVPAEDWKPKQKVRTVDEYRRAGLPMTTAWMESLVKEINYRVKGTEMFWNNPGGAEAILQVRAAALCDDDRLAQHLETRPGSPSRSRQSVNRALRYFNSSMMHELMRQSVVKMVVFVMRLKHSKCDRNGIFCSECCNSW